MSHLKYRVGNTPPDTSGNLNVTLGDLSGVDTSSINDGDVLSYGSATGWHGSAPASANARAVLSWSPPRSASYSVSSNAYGVNDNTLWYNSYFTYENSALVSRTNASGTLVPVTDTNFTQYFTLKASGLQGKVIDALATYVADNVTTSNKIVYQWCIGTGDLSTFTPVGALAEQSSEYTQTATASFVMGTSDINLALKVIDVTGACSTMTSVDAIYSCLNITAS